MLTNHALFGNSSFTTKYDEYIIFRGFHPHIPYVRVVSDNIFKVATQKTKNQTGIRKELQSRFSNAVLERLTNNFLFIRGKGGVGGSKLINYLLSEVLAHIINKVLTINLNSFCALLSPWKASLVTKKAHQNYVVASWISLLHFP